MNDDLQKIKDVYQDLFNMIKTTTEYDKEEFKLLINRLYNYFDKKYSDYHVGRFGVEIRGDINDYELSHCILMNNIYLGLRQLIADLTLAYWRKVLNRTELTDSQVLSNVEHF